MFRTHAKCPATSPPFVLCLLSLGKKNFVKKLPTIDYRLFTIDYLLLPKTVKIKTPPDKNKHSKEKMYERIKNIDAKVI